MALGCCKNDRQPHKQDGKWSVLVLISTFLQGWLFIGSGRGYGVYLPILMEEFNEGRDKIALIGSLSLGIAFLLTVFVTWLNLFIDNRIVCTAGHLFLILAFSVSSFVKRVELLYFTYSILQAMGMSLTLTTHVLVIVKYFKKHRSLAQGINSSGGALGIMTVPNALQYLIDSYGWRNTLRFQAGAVAMVSILCLMYSPNVETENKDDEETQKGIPNKAIRNLKSANDVAFSKNCEENVGYDEELELESRTEDKENDKSKDKDSMEDQEKKSIESDEVELRREGHEVTTVDHLVENKAPTSQKATSLKAMFDMSIWRVPKFTISVISVCIGTFAIFSNSVHLVKFSEEMGNLDGRRATTIYVFLGLSSLIARIVAGKLCDISWIEPSMVNMAADLIGGINTFLLTLSTSYIHLAVMYFIHGFADGMFRTSSIVLFTSCVERSKSGSAFGQGNSLAAPFNIAGPAITGLLADVFNGYTLAYYMNGSILLVAAAVHLVPAIVRRCSGSRDFTLEQFNMPRDLQSVAVDVEENEIQSSKINPSFLND